LLFDCLLDRVALAWGEGTEHARDVHHYARGALDEVPGPG
jgi:hypothetical protein